MMTPWLSRLRKEPTFHFFVIGALLFVGHRLVIGDPRTIVVGAGVKSDLERRFRDENGRKASPDELQAILKRWKGEEALYREALRERLDRDDATIRIVLADKMRARTVQAMPKREPTDAELDNFLALHLGAYEAPWTYAFELVSFPKADPASEKLRTGYEAALATGASPAKLGRPILSGNLTRDDLKEKFGPVLADAMCGLPVGKWQDLQGDKDLLLVRITGLVGGIPNRSDLRPRLVSDWTAWRQQQAIEQMIEDVVKRYRIEAIP